MLNFARARKLPNQVGFNTCDAGELPFENGSVECIVSLRFFHLFRSAQRYVFTREFDRILRPGGHLICSFTNGWYLGGINFLCKAFGFRTVEFLYPGEMGRLFPGYEILALRGNFLPFQWTTSLLGVKCESLSQWMTSRTTLNRVCWERYYLLRKPC